MAAVSFYLDEMTRRTIAEQLVKRGIEAIMAVDVGMRSKSDQEQSAYSTSQGLVLFTRDKKFANLTAARTDHAGLICWNGEPDDIGGQVRALADFAEQHTAEDAAGHVFWLK